MTPAQNITRYYNGDWHGNYGAFPAPGHSKADRGVTVKDADNGNVLFHSFNGADWKPLKDECRALGLLPERVRANDRVDPQRWPYMDATGRAPYAKARVDLPGQKYQYQHFDGERWKPGRGGAKAIPYRLPELLAASADAMLVMAEGEKHADKLASWGFIATSLKDWRPEFAEHVAGRTVVILPDNDQPGIDQADKAARLVNAAGGRAFIVTLPGVPPSGDIIDWTGTADDLRKLIDAALHDPDETFSIADLTAWATTDPQPKSFIMAGFVPQGEVTLFTGAGGTNKSTFGLQLCACSTASLPMLGVPVASGAALYVTAEEEDRENHWRLLKIAQQLGTTLDRLAGRLHVVSLRGRLNNELATFDGEGRLHVAPAYKLLRATIEATGSRLVVLDNVAHLFNGNENDRGNVTAFVNLLYQLCRDLGCTIVLVAHPNKTGDSYSGSTAWLNAVRSQIVLERPDGNPDPDTRVLSLGKANYARPDQQLAFRWHDFALVRDEDMEPSTMSEIAKVSRVNAENQRFLDCLAKATADRRAVSHVNGSNYAPRMFAKMIEGKAMSVVAFEQAMERLLHIGKIKLDQPLWQDAHRHWKQGIKAAENCGDPPAATPCGDPRRPPTQATENACGDPRAATPLYTTYKSGAAHGSAAPLETEDVDPFDHRAWDAQR